ncbi:NAD(P)-binding protein [Xylariaceae sp. FL1272]|nr:NAD(P)-binding protein [Xylariaceae sp. FL1272]
MAPKKIISVIGATGNQGFSVARTFSALPGWQVRAITRNPSSDKSKELSSLGCVVTKADLSDKSSLSRAFEGSHAIFVNTDFWAAYRASVAAGDAPEKSSAIGWDTEILHGKNAAAAAAGVPTLEKFIYSALGPMKRASEGKYYRSMHWETKSAIVDYIENEQPELAKKSSFIYIGGYTTNQFLLPRPNPATGEYVMIAPCPATTRMPIIDAQNSPGPFVRALVEDEAPGKKLLAYDSYLNVDQVAEVWSKVTGKPSKYIGMTMEAVHHMTKIPFEVLEGAAFIGEYGYMGGIPNAIEPDQLKNKPNTPTYEEWLKGREINELLSIPDINEYLAGNN